MLISVTLVLAFLRRYWREALLLLAVLWIAGGFIAGHREEVREATKPVVAQQTRQAEGWKERPVEGCPPVIEKVIPPKEAKRIERDFGVSLGHQEIPHEHYSENGPLPLTAETAIKPNEPRVLGLFEVPEMRYGGEALSLLQPDGHNSLTFKPAPPPFISFRPTWGLGAGVDPFNWRESWRGYALVEPLHFREKWHIRGTAGFESRSGDPKAVLTLGLEYRSR